MSEIKRDKATLVFTGDIGFDRYMDGKWDDEELLSKEVLAFLHSGDHVIANVEGPLVDQATNTTTEGVQQLMHTMNPAAIKVLQKMKADIWNICNNHIMDAGEMGMKCTLEQAEKHGVKTIGAGMNLKEAKKPLILPDAGGIGMFGVGYQRGCKTSRRRESRMSQLGRYGDNSKMSSNEIKNDLPLVCDRVPWWRGIYITADSLYERPVSGISEDGRGCSGLPSSPCSHEL